MLPVEGDGDGDRRENAGTADAETIGTLENTAPSIFVTCFKDCLLSTVGTACLTTRHPHQPCLHKENGLPIMLAVLEIRQDASDSALT